MSSAATAAALTKTEGKTIGQFNLCRQSRQVIEVFMKIEDHGGFE